ncbi:hypothetical protein SDC9_120523 [bioreactor metagenome]|uniref:Uncharacterized protein n=1 Tax=bioreactor metagenome TaxID=1076179 RepID=A0A645C8B1_9ZZZZ
MVCHPLQKIAVVSHHHKAPGPSAQPVLQPGNHLRVQMVCRLVQNQHVRGMNQRRRKGHPLALSAGKRADFLLRVRNAQPGQHGDRLVFVQRPKFLWKAEKHLLQYRGAVIQLRVLGKKAHLHVGVPAHRAAVRLNHPGQHPQKSGLPGSVHADDAHPVALVQIKIHIFQQLPAAKVDAQPFRRDQHRVLLQGPGIQPAPFVFFSILLHPAPSRKPGTACPAVWRVLK